MTEYTVKVFLQDELPKFGCGWRTLKIKEGRKWMRIEDVSGRRVMRKPKGTLDKLRPERLD
jgi:hypothetical protein